MIINYIVGNGYICSCCRRTSNDFVECLQNDNLVEQVITKCIAIAECNDWDFKIAHISDWDGDKKQLINLINQSIGARRLVVEQQEQEERDRWCF